MFHKLEELEARYEQLNELLSDIEISNDPKKMTACAKEQASLAETVMTYRDYKALKEQKRETEELLAEGLSQDLQALAREELSELEGKLGVLLEQLHMLLIPKDPNDQKNVIMEIRGAAGGDEAAIFASNLYRMYTKYAEAKRWKIEVLEYNVTGLGGFKEIVVMISGLEVYAKLKYESGAHRVQRVPETESGGRIHTSTATVVCLPEIEEVDIEIHDKDIRVDIFCASGPGGQSVNTTASAVRVTHIPTGIMATCQDEKSQIRNKEKALKVLRARIYEVKEREAQAEYDQNRKSAVGTGDRSERIRTYNYPQNRVTDHRIGLTLQKLDSIMEGRLDEIIDALTLHEQTKLMTNVD